MAEFLRTPPPSPKSSKSYHESGPGSGWPLSGKQGKVREFSPSWKSQGEFGEFFKKEENSWMKLKILT